jgi:hypothetical protein
MPSSTRRSSARTTKPKPQPAQTAEQQLETLVAKLDPPAQKLLRAVRASFRKRFPTAFELVYDYSHSLVIAVGATDRGFEATFSIAAGADGVRLYFLNGPELPDPHELLLGKAKQVRYVRIPSVATLREAAVAQLILEAAKLGKAMPSTGRGELIVKTSSKKPRPARKG